MNDCWEEKYLRSEHRVFSPNDQPPLLFIKKNYEPFQGNVFFAHGIRMKELNEREMKEFEDYKLALEKFKKERRAYEIYLSDLYRDKVAELITGLKMAWI